MVTRANVKMVTSMIQMENAKLSARATMNTSTRTVTNANVSMDSPSKTTNANPSAPVKMSTTIMVSVNVSMDALEVVKITNANLSAKEITKLLDRIINASARMDLNIIIKVFANLRLLAAWVFFSSSFPSCIFRAYVRPLSFSSLLSSKPSYHREPILTSFCSSYSSFF